MKRLLVVILACGLAGCTSFAEMRDREPSISSGTAKSPDAYLGCVQPRLAARWPQLTTIRDGDGWVVSVADHANVLASVTVRPDGSGSTVEYRQANNLTWGAFAHYRQAVHDCL